MPTLLDYKSAVVDGTKALEIDPKYTKALHRRGKANAEMGNYDKAIEDYQKIMEVEPNNQEVNGDLMDARAHVNSSSSKKDKKAAAATTEASKNNFKRITIQEEDSEEEDSPQIKKASVETSTQKPTPALSKSTFNTDESLKKIDSLLNIGRNILKLDESNDPNSR